MTTAEILQKEIKKDRAMMELEMLDSCLRDAREWRNRIRGPLVHIRDCEKDEILFHFDKAMRAAEGYRAKLIDKETEIRNDPRRKKSKSEYNERYRNTHRKEIGNEARGS